MEQCKFCHHDIHPDDEQTMSPNGPVHEPCVTRYHNERRWEHVRANRIDEITSWILRWHLDLEFAGEIMWLKGQEHPFRVMRGMRNLIPYVARAKMIPAKERASILQRIRGILKEFYRYTIVNSELSPY